jgi:hypothetical protein
MATRAGASLLHNGLLPCIDGDGFGFLNFKYYESLVMLETHEGCHSRGFTPEVSGYR